VTSTEVIGLIPAAGRAARLPGLPCSKEIVPVGRDAAGHPVPVAAHLLWSYRAAGIARAVVVTRTDKRDLSVVLGDGARFGVALEWLELTTSPSLPHTIDHARAALGRRRVALGLPDCLVRPRSIFASLVSRQSQTGAAVVLGVVPTDRPDKADIVETDADGTVRGIAIKQPDTGARNAWVAALWTESFSDYLHDFVAALPEPLAREPHLGEIFTAALDDGPRARSAGWHD